MAKELWKDIKGYEGIYQVSNMGRVKSLEREIGHRYNGKTRTIPERIMHACDNGNGYKVVYLVKDGSRKSKYIHSLVAECFLQNQTGKNYINHKDYDTSNNDIDNLEWCTQKENVSYSKHKMKHRKQVTHSNTGEKYITMRGDKYRVVIDRKECGTFKLLEDAIKERNKILNETV